MVEIQSVIKLTIAALIPVLAAAVFYLLDRKTAFGRLKNVIKQIIYGVVFGAIAVLGTEWGIPMNGAVVNSRDSAVLIAGLFFGSPAGIIAGTIGGLERWIGVAWGLGVFTRVACSVSTFLAGIYAAFLRKLLFEDKRPNALLSLSIGVVMEVFHLSMVFLTNMDSMEKSMLVVEACTLPMVVANSVSVMIAAIVITLLSHEKIRQKQTSVKISQTIQRWLLVTVLAAFAITSFFLFSLQDKTAAAQTDSLLEIAINEIAEDINDASDGNLLEVTKAARGDTVSLTLDEIKEKYSLAEINIIDSKGFIAYSTDEGNIGFNMASSSQTAEFLCLLGNVGYYVQEFGPTVRDMMVWRKYAGVKTASGFIEVGYDADHFHSLLDSEVKGITKNRHIGQNGIIIIFDKEGNIVSSPDGIDTSLVEYKFEKVKLPHADETFFTDFTGEKCYARHRVVEGYTIVSVLPEDEALRMRNIALYVNTFLEILVFGALFVIIYLLIKKVVVNQIKSINKSLSKISDGNLDVVVDVRTNEEFASLSDDINMTVDTLKEYIAEASARIDKELEFAKNIQESALPNQFPAFPKRKDFDVFASMNPAKEVGGDFYDFYVTHDDTFNFLVADVSGKGIPAAMFMMRAKTELKSLTEADVPIGEVFTKGNAALCEGNDAGMFVTAWQGSADLNTGLVRFANAGHNPPLVYHGSTGRFDYLRAKVGFVLAGMDGVKYKPQELQLERGDIVFLYTDGVTEATNAETQLYGEERLLETINSKEFDNVREMCEYIKADVDKFVGDAPQFDDITMLAFRYIGKPQAAKMTIEEAVIDDIPKFTEFVEGELEKLDCPMKAVMQIDVALDELLSNIIKYGYPKKPGLVEVKVATKDDEPNTVYLTFRDYGIPYNPLTKEDPDTTLSAEERGIGGLGIYIVRKTMDDVKYKYENEQNILTIKKVWG